MNIFVGVPTHMCFCARGSCFVLPVFVEWGNGG